MMCDTVEREVIRKDLLCNLRWIRSTGSDHVSITARSMYPSDGYKHFMMLVLDKDEKWTRIPVSLHEKIDLRNLFADVMVRFDTQVPIACQVHVDSGDGGVHHVVSEKDSVESLGLDDPNTIALVFF